MVSMVSSLLPPSSTALERAYEAAFQAQLPGPLADAPARLKSVRPDAVVPWLAAEWWLADFAAYHRDAHALIAAGLPWLKVRGTAVAVKQALAWIGMGAALEEDGARLHLDPGTADAPEQLAAIKQLVGASIPAHVQFYRLVHGYDRRVLRVSSGDRWDDDFLSDDSGVWVDGVKLSFGRRLAQSSPRGETALRLATLRTHAARTRYPDVLRYDDSRFGDLPVRNHPVMRGRIVGQGNAAGLDVSRSLSGRRRIARAAFPLSDDARLGDPNTRFGGYAETAINRFYWSDPGSQLSAFDPGRIRTPIDEVWIVAHALAAVAPGARAIGARRHRLHASRADWRGLQILSQSLRWSDKPIAEPALRCARARLHTQAVAGLADRAGAWHLVARRHAGATAAGVPGDWTGSAWQQHNWRAGGWDATRSWNARTPLPL